MSARRTVRVFVGVLAALALASNANAQFGQFYDSLPFGSHDRSYTDQSLHEPRFHPFIEPGYFNHDLQFFAPAADIDAYGGSVMRTGWFGTYSRMHVRVSRPDYTPSFDRMDTTYGNRWDVGYMIDDVNYDHGWLCSYMHIDGPGAFDQPVGIYIADEEVTAAGGAAATGDEIRRPPEFRGEEDSLNVGELHSIELSKLFRTEPLNHGGLLEPFFGVRYIKFRSLYQDQTFIGYDDAGDYFLFPPAPPGTIPPGATAAIDWGDITQLDIISNRLNAVNHMLGGQLGVRWHKRLNRWNLSSEFRAFAFQNFQQMRSTVDSNRKFYDDFEERLPQEIPEANSSTIVDSHSTDTVVGTDIRAEVAFEVTRDISLSVGVEYMGFYNGIFRGAALTSNSEDLHMFAFTFGGLVNH